MSFDTGPVVTYLGGASAAVGAQYVQAQAVPSPEVIPLMSVPLPVPVVEVTIGDVISILSFGAMLWRLRWEVKKERKK